MWSVKRTVISSKAQRATLRCYSSASYQFSSARALGTIAYIKRLLCKPLNPKKKVLHEICLPTLKISIFDQNSGFMKLYIATFFQAIFAQYPINSSWIKFLNWSLKAKYSRFYRHLGFSSVQDLDVNNVTSSLLCSLRTNYQRLTASIPFTKETSGYSSGTTITKLTHLDIYEPLIHYYQFQTARADLLCMQSPSPIEFQRNVRFEDIIITIFRLVTLSDHAALW